MDKCKGFQIENIDKWLKCFKDISSHLKFSLSLRFKNSLSFPTPIFLLCFFHVSGVEIRFKDPQRKIIGSEYWTGHLCGRLYFQQMEVEIILLVFQSRTEPRGQRSRMELNRKFVQYLIRLLQIPKCDLKSNLYRNHRCQDRVVFLAIACSQDFAGGLRNSYKKNIPGTYDENVLLPKRHNDMLKIKLVINNSCAMDLASKGKNNTAQNACEYSESPMWGKSI